VKYLIIILTLLMVACSNTVTETSEEKITEEPSPSVKVEVTADATDPIDDELEDVELLTDEPDIDVSSIDDW